jgi:hypothetical protein
MLVRLRTHDWRRALGCRYSGVECNVTLRLGNRAAEPDAISDAIGYAKFYSYSHDAVIWVFDKTGAIVNRHGYAGDFREP